MNQRLVWALLLGLLFFLGDSVLPGMIGPGWTLIIFGAVPLVVGLPVVGRAARAPVLRYAPAAAVLWYVVLFVDAGHTPDPPLPALIPLAAAGISIWTAIGVQAYSAWKRARTGG